MRLIEGGFGWWSRLIALALLGSFAACKTSSLTPADGALPATETACDPLAAKPVTLGTIVGVGQDAAGTLYVDAANGVFVSEGGRLLRQHVTGSGQSGATEFLFGFEPAGDDGSSGAQPAGRSEQGPPPSPWRSDQRAPDPFSGSRMPGSRH